MATSVLEQPQHLESVASGYSKTSRRQYQSCDQCRKSRRACDAATVRVIGFPLGDDDPQDTPEALVDACSNCARTSKRCTFEWLRTLPKQSLPKGIKRKLGLTGASGSIVTTQPVSLTSEAEYYSHANDGAQAAGGLAQFPSQSAANHQNDSPNILSEQIHLHDSACNLDQNGFVERMDLQNGSSLQEHQESRPDSMAYPLNGPPSTETHRAQKSNAAVVAGYDLSSSSPSSGSSSSPSGRHIFTARPYRNPSSTNSEPEQEANHTQHPPQKIQRQSHQTLHHLANVSTSKASPGSPSSRRASSSTSSFITKRSGVAPLSPRQVRFADNAMKSMIATGLLRIYHDSFENSLSCWVTEKNCPYEMELLQLIQQSSPSSLAEEAAFRLCDNRIFSRVSRLDLAFSPLRGRPLTTHENRAASQALNAAIMAFASQWSHSSHNAFWRSKEGRSHIKAWQAQPNRRHSNSPVDDPVVSGECERMIQRTLWNEAKTAIQASGEIDSFKVILAYMIFALTQRPVDPKPSKVSSKDRSRTESLATTSSSSQRGSTEPGATETHADLFADPGIHATMLEEWNPFYATDLEALASPPIYLETAVRNLFSWRRKVERYRRMHSRPRASDSTAQGLRSLTLKDQQTFNILFWLGVMCDTTSSAISRRPLVIPDEDCAMIHEEMQGLQIDGQKNNRYGWEPGHHADADDEEQAGALWGSYLLRFKWAGPRSTPPRWPCSFEDAALVLQEAIPVKVLMFRKVGQLQTLAYRRSAPRKLEKCIEEALAVYQQWNETYGQFMTDCANEHNLLPPHVQSWYVILDGHWHYGCLLLADAIASVDREAKTMQPQRNLRSSCGLIVELRHDNALAIARIAQVSLSEHAPSFPDNPEFHFACNGSAILTEPWTDILVRAMGSACKIFINWLSTWDNSRDPAHGWVLSHTTYDELFFRAETCIHGMSLLGRKSDAANLTASVFSDRLDRVSANHDRVMERMNRSLSGDLVPPRPAPNHFTGVNPPPTAT